MKANNYVKPAVILLATFFFMASAKAQTVRKDSTKTFSMSLNFSSAHNQNNSFSFTVKNNPKHFSLYYDTLGRRPILYDNYRQQYYYEDPLMPYGNFQSALFFGTANYLMFLFEKKK